MKTIESVKIRMYRQGLGDCFLLTFKQSNDKEFTMLIDCGVLSKSKIHKDKMIEVAKHIKETTANKLDVVVGTHEHWDHLSGFLQAKDIFDEMEINQIWMAWTENPKDAFAKELKESYKAKLAAISIAYDKLKKEDTHAWTAKQKSFHDLYLNAYVSFFNFFGIDEEDNVLFQLNNTESAFDVLRQRKNTDKIYLEPETNEVIELEELPGVRIYVLGPPKNSKALKKMNPSKSKSEVYEHNFNVSLGQSFASALSEENDENKPFEDSECYSFEQATDKIPTYFSAKNDWRTIENDWLYAAGNLAIALDSGINNTSLALAFEFVDSGKVMLFPADAQVGNWLSWSNYEWAVSKNGIKETITIDDLLKRTVFYKVGHHGSHNATMKELGLEKMNNNELIAMIPVNKEMASSRNWKMPFKPLLEALNQKAKDRVIIQDEAFPASIKSGNRVTNGMNDLYYDIEIHNR